MLKAVKERWAGPREERANGLGLLHAVREEIFAKRRGALQTDFSD